MAVKLPISIVDDSDYALSKRTDVYLLVIYQKAFGNNTIAGKRVPIDAQIGSSTSYFGTSAGASHPFAARVGIRHKF
jgi:predicted porin